MGDPDDGVQLHAADAGAGGLGGLPRGPGNSAAARGGAGRRQQPPGGQHQMRDQQPRARWVRLGRLCPKP